MRFRFFGVEEGPPCHCGGNHLMVLAAIWDGKDEWKCPVLWRLF